MFFIAKISLLVLLAVITDGKDHEEIVDKMSPIYDVMLFYHMSGIDPRYGFEQKLETTDTLVTDGLKLFTKLTDFAESIIMICDDFNETEPRDDLDMALGMTAYPVNGLRSFMEDNNLVERIDNKSIKEKFNNCIKYQVNLVQKVVYDFLEKPNNNTIKKVLRNECNTTNGMKDVMTDLHNEIVDKDGHNDTFNQLLNGGVSFRPDIGNRWGYEYFRYTSLAENFCKNTPPPPLENLQLINRLGRT